VKRISASRVQDRLELVHLALISRLPLHGEVLYDRMRTDNQVTWIGQNIPHAVTVWRAIPLMLFEFVSLLRYRSSLKGETPVIMIQFVSIDVFPALAFRRLFGGRVVLYAIGSDLLGVMVPAQTKILRYVLSQADAVACVNREIRGRIQLMGRGDAILLPTPPSSDVMAPLGTDSKLYDVVTVGALTSQKMQSTLIESCRFL
jgi:hypothetical protein